ncbi:MAG: hypothetical protein KGJ44_09110 [Betaproteobacteria bacterium]|nr:hypothetical protein [Betaproteobacteria bacterium]
MGSIKLQTLETVLKLGMRGIKRTGRAVLRAHTRHCTDGRRNTRTTANAAMGAMADEMH